MDTIYSRLREWRQTTARELNVPPFLILGNAYLAGIAELCPTSLEELAACPGMGPKKLQQFGASLVQLISECVDEGLPTGVEPEPPGEPLPEAAVAEIADALRKELARSLTRRFKGRYTQAQVEEALRRLSISA